MVMGGRTQGFFSALVVDRMKTSALRECSVPPWNLGICTKEGECATTLAGQI